MDTFTPIFRAVLCAVLCAFAALMLKVPAVGVVVFIALTLTGVYAGLRWALLRLSRTSRFGHVARGMKYAGQMVGIVFLLGLCVLFPIWLAVKGGWLGVGVLALLGVWVYAVRSPTLGWAIVLAYLLGQ